MKIPKKRGRKPKGGKVVTCLPNEENIVEQEVLEPQKPKTKYRTYKRIIPMMKTDRMNIERTTDLQDARRYILKTFDSYKSKIPSSSSPK
mgnify:CR=1 FL=1